MTSVKEAGKLGGKQKGINTPKTKYELAVAISAHVTHKDELIEMLKVRSVPWLRAKYDELTQHKHE